MCWGRSNNTEIIVTGKRGKCRDCVSGHLYSRVRLMDDSVTEHLVSTDSDGQNYK